MKRTTVFTALGVAVAAIGIGIAPSAAADTANCQQIGAATVCGQGNIRGGAQYAGPSGPGSGPSGGCTNAYGAYQNCQAGHN
jgi:hypothetical protein